MRGSKPPKEVWVVVDGNGLLRTYRDPKMAVAMAEALSRQVTSIHHGENTVHKYALVAAVPKKKPRVDGGE